MSALSNIRGDYATDEDSENDNIDVNQRKRIKLPKPNLDNIVVVSGENHCDDPGLHSGRVRSFPHVRGNWSTFVFVKYPENESMQSLIDKFELIVNTVGPAFKCEDLHTSLSKTVVIKYHMITGFISLLKSALKDLSSFELGFDCVKVYCNEECTRTFIAVTADYLSSKYLRTLISSIDKVLEEYKLPIFYDDPSYHMSLLWVNGNRKDELEKHIQDLNNITHQLSLKSVPVNKVLCKVGNKQYQFLLD